MLSPKTDGNVSSNEIMDIYQSSAVSTINRKGEQVAANIPTSTFSNKFSAIMGGKALHTGKKDIGK